MPDKWDEDGDSTPPSSPPTKAATAGVARRGKFDDEESEDSDVLEDWDDADDSETERAKAAAAAEKKAKADAEAAANKKSKTQRTAERIAENKARKAAEEESDDESSEDEATKRARLRKTEKDADLGHAEDLFGGVGNSTSASTRKAPTSNTAVALSSSDPLSTIDLSTLPLFDPKTKTQFEALRDTLVPVLTANSKKAHYGLFLQEFTKQLAKDLTSDQMKKIASGLTALSNEKMKEEKAADKGGKKTKAAKTKTTLAAGRNVATTADTNNYDDAYGDDDFM